MKTLAGLTVMLLVSGLALAAPQAQPVTKQDFVKVCPLDLPGVTAASTPTADGVSVAFATSVANSLPELRTRVQKLSDLLNRAMAQPPASAVVFSSAFESTKDGASVLLKPKNAAELEKLQTNVAGKIGTMNAEKTCNLLANVN